MTAAPEPARDPRDELMECRNAIEVVDQRIVALLARRVELGLRAARAKRGAGMPIVDSARETQVIDAATDAAVNAGLPGEPVRAIFERVVELCRRAQEPAR